MIKTKVLVVVDMQNDFITGPLGTKEARAIVPKVINKIKEWSGELYFTQDTHDKFYLSTMEGKYLPIEHCIYPSEGWRLHPDIRKVVGPIPTFIKSTFGCTSLVTTISELAQVNEIEKIELIGVCTDICVISNALLLKAFFPEIEIVVDAECCAGTDLESHVRALKAMRKCHIRVLGD